MTITTIKAMAPEWFTPRSQAKDPKPAQFKVVGLSGHNQALVASEVEITPTGDLTFSADGILTLFRLGLLGWQNVVDADGNPVEFLYKTPRQVQDLLPYTDQVAIAAEIFNRSFLSPIDKKK